MRFLKTREGMVNVECIVALEVANADDHEVHVCATDGVIRCFVAPRSMTKTDAAHALLRALLDENGPAIITAKTL